MAATPGRQIRIFAGLWNCTDFFLHHLRFSRASQHYDPIISSLRLAQSRSLILSNALPVSHTLEDQDTITGFVSLRFSLLFIQTHAFIRARTSTRTRSSPAKTQTISNMPRLALRSRSFKATKNLRRRIKLAHRRRQQAAAVKPTTRAAPVPATPSYDRLPKFIPELARQYEELEDWQAQKTGRPAALSPEFKALLAKDYEARQQWKADLNKVYSTMNLAKYELLVEADERRVKELHEGFERIRSRLFVQPRP
ncbi:hypothetical protein AK830_g4694 [Neonectria ditissima]|uniref:Uncharacterized protein n=1 Tax=Neonectria ditissima TaxID=78410 RepID=A0A0P7AV86_9HYPO|nr:hypothetical protein AK830_g4694 [Neonectria ditissima]